MGKKRRNYPNLEELLSRPWCYYCERDFEDLKLLISHQKAKHYKCDRCGRRLNTAGGLSVHMNQVHKETLVRVENAIEGREGLDVEIFGMEGVPEAAATQHNNEILQGFQKDRASRQAVTGNPQPGQPGVQRPAKKIRIESADELKHRLAEYRAQEGARKAAAAAGPPPAPSAPIASASASASASAPATSPTSLPNRPPNSGIGGPAGLPQRPSAYGTGAASTLDDLVSGAAHGGDDIDKIIRMAEAGIRPPAPQPGPPAAQPAAPEKEKKKEKAMRMVYSDGDFSLEERMALIPRYAVATA
ncbi:c2h2 finger domain containing protein [Grosmannia clavigera kw1407]|uniref:C2h2 finger domain containing protein n=1 Tax=Grosmannia clavigera (strain kw1407 / UAMH 11150) TaxID=655863 RepID=F0XCK3_GROCL|nr:c2h2 finger domain containing protein [Grosmannia clavigera kw1407]EFX04634.1 c2h2 finger domain containing protein [Grosmannia clavigera kw1407]